MRTKSIYQFINHLIIFVFLGHGILYYFYPEDVLDSNSPLKLVKYVCVLLLFLFNFKSVRIKDLAAFLLFAVFVFLSIGISHNLQDQVSTYLLRCINYTFPFAVILFRDALKLINFKRIFFSIALLAISAAFVDFYIIRGVFSYINFLERGGFLRTASIFVTPNNAGFCFFLLYVYILQQYNPDNTLLHVLLKMLLMILVIWSILLTGSKTGLLLIMIYHVLDTCIRFLFPSKIRIKKIHLRFLISLTAVSIIMLTILIPLANIDLSAFFIGAVEDFRGFNLETGSIRYEQIVDFFARTNNSFLSPDYNLIEKTYDNALIQLWGDFNFLGATLFLGYILLLSFNALKRVSLAAGCIIIIFLLSTFSLNVFYLWPLTYIFWHLLLISKRTNGQASKLQK